jgi:PAS domain S-box-containing protein
MDVSNQGLDLAHVFAALPNAVIVSDAAGWIMSWNPTAETLFGWSEAEVRGRSIVEVLRPAPDHGPIRVSLAQVLDGEEWQGDRVVLRRDGTSVRIFSRARAIVDPDSGNTIGIVGMATDVTDRRVAEQQLRDLAHHFGLALEAGGLGTWRWDMADGSTLWDERLERLYGFEPGGFDGTFETYVACLHPEDRSEVLDAVQRAVDSTSNYQLEHRIVWPDESVRWVYCAGAVTVDDAGAPTGTIGCVVDTTDRVAEDQERRRRATEAIEAATSALIQHERLQFVLAINDTLNSAASVQEIMANVTSAAVPRLGDWCTIHVLPFDGGEIPESDIAHVDPAMVAFARDLQQRFPYVPDAPTGVPKVMRSGQTEFYPDINDDLLTDLEATAEERELIERLALGSAIAVPLVKHGRVLGAMQFVMSKSSRRYAPDDVALAEAVAGRIAASLENRRLNEQQRLIAETLQRSLLPASIPRIDGLDIAVRYSAAGEASEVGGDFYDVFAIDDDTWAVVIGDVCGTGPAAASLTGLARHSIRASAWHGDGPVDVLRSLNRAVLRSQSDSFCTAAFATFAPTGAAFTLSVTCGGHPLPIRVRDGVATSLGRYGTLLGMLAEIECATTTTTVRPGDLIVFFTDGATDVAPPHLLTADEFESLVSQCGGGSADEVADRILERLEGILPFHERNDDLALLVVRVHDTSLG